MPRDDDALNDFREEYLAYLEGDRTEPPALQSLPDEERRIAEAFVDSITAARGVDPYASRPSIEQLLAARTAASSSIGEFGNALQAHLRLTVDRSALVAPDVAADAIGLESELVILARGMRIRMVRSASSADLASALPARADAIGRVFANFPDTHAVLFASAEQEPRGVVVDRGDACQAIETPSGESRPPRLRRPITDVGRACEVWLRGMIPEFEPPNTNLLEPTRAPDSGLSPYTVAAKAVGQVSTAGARARIDAKRATWGAFGDQEVDLLAAIVQEAQSGLLPEEQYRARLEEIVGAAA